MLIFLTAYFDSNFALVIGSIVESVFSNDNNKCVPHSV